MDREPRYRLRAAAPEDEPFLWEMLHQAIFVPEGEPPPPREIVREPSISRYVSGWGRAGDEGVVAMDSETGVQAGAAWFRLFTTEEPGFGFVNPATPEISIAVAAGHRGRGLGTAMLNRLIAGAGGRYGALSLSCDPANPAWRLYRRLGFELETTERTMRLDLRINRIESD